MDAETAILGNYVVDSETGCWLWSKSLDGHGYGQCFVYGKMRRAHRIAYQLLRGPIPVGLSLDHLCRVSGCINPSHLEPVTHQENVLRGISPPAIHAKKTHCVNGHEFSPDNTKITVTGARLCIACRREYDRRRYRSGRITAAQPVEIVCP